MLVIRTGSLDIHQQDYTSQMQYHLRFPEKHATRDRMIWEVFLLDLDKHIHIKLKVNLPTPLAGGLENSFAPQMIFLWPPARGVGK